MGTLGLGVRVRLGSIMLDLKKVRVFSIYLLHLSGTRV